METDKVITPNEFFDNVNNGIKFEVKTSEVPKTDDEKYLEDLLLSPKTEEKEEEIDESKNKILEAFNNNYDSK